MKKPRKSADFLLARPTYRFGNRRCSRIAVGAVNWIQPRPPSHPPRRTPKWSHSPPSLIAACGPGRPAIEDSIDLLVSDCSTIHNIALLVARNPV